MADPNLTQGVWDEYWERFGILAGLWNDLRQQRRRCEEEVVRHVNEKDFNSNFAASSLTLTGARLGVNTHASGVLYVRITGGPTYTVSLYTATGGSGLVAQGTASAGGTATLAEQNGSGLSGSVTLAGSVNNETDDVHVIRVLPDFKLTMADFDKGIDRDGEMEQVCLGLFDSVAASLRSAETAVRNAVNQMFALQIGPAALSGQTVMINRAITEDDGALSVAFRGLLEDLRLAAKQNNGGSTPQTVLKAVLSVGAVSYLSGNVGSGTTPTATAYEYQEAGTWTGVCVDDTLGSEEFEMSFSPSDPERKHLSYRSPNNLQIKREWKDPGPGLDQGQAFVGISSLTIGRSRTVTNVSGTPLSTTATDWSETGEDSSNTDSGVLYVSVVANGSNFDISFYSDSNKPSASLVAKATNIAANSTFTATARNKSGLTVFGKSHASIAAGNTATVDLKVFSTDGRTDGDPDRFEFTITETSIGEWQKVFRELLTYYMNSAASSETVKEYFATRHSVGAIYEP